MRKGRRDGTSMKAALSSTYWHESEACRVLKLWQESGLSLKAFADRHGIGRARLQRWKTRLEDSTAPAFHPVQVVFDSKPRQDSVGGASPGRVELVLGNGRRVAVGSGFDASVLKELVGVVESWSC